ncbi:MAG TPA: hypothetical protein VMW52_01985 [Phycisphaerae bacterium]|nr:hypothetical protein [Phycisphaerae bacterium]
MAYEDLQNDYTEVDIGADRVVLSTVTATVSNIDRDEEVYVYKDFGAAHFDVYEHLSEVEFTGNNGQFAYGAANVIGGELDDFYNNTDASGWVMKYDGANYSIEIWHMESGNLREFDQYTPAAQDTPYYVKYTRLENGDCGGRVYSDAARTNLLDTLTMNDDGDARRYSFGMSGMDKPASGDAISYLVTNIDLQEAPPAAGNPWYAYAQQAA